MRKIYIGLITGMLVVCAAGIALLQWGTVLEVYKERTFKSTDALNAMAALSPEQLEKERNLARWYNFSLRNNNQDAGHQEAYEALLDFGAGQMGYLEIPGQGMILPLVHDLADASENRAIHSFGTALPVGGRGNCPVLRCDGIAVSTEDVFCIYVLDVILIYQVVEIGSEAPLNIAGEDLCVLLLTSESGTIYATGVRIQETADHSFRRAIGIDAVCDSHRTEKTA